MQSDPKWRMYHGTSNSRARYFTHSCCGRALDQDVPYRRPLGLPCGFTMDSRASGRGVWSICRASRPWQRRLHDKAEGADEDRLSCRATANGRDFMGVAAFSVKHEGQNEAPASAGDLGVVRATACRKSFVSGRGCAHWGWIWWAGIQQLPP